MRDLINIITEGLKPKLRPTPQDIAEIEKERHAIRAAEGGGGMCHFVSEWIEHNFGWERASGTYLTPAGEVICGGGHYWNILPDGAILDATADQFGEGHGVRIVEPGDPEWSRYDIEWYRDWHPGHAEYDPSWHRARRAPEAFTGELDGDAQNRLRKERGDHWWLGDKAAINDYLAKDRAYGEDRRRVI